MKSSIMFASRMLLRAPGPILYLPVQIRAFSLARIALEPAKKAAPEPVAPTRKTTVKTPVGTVKKSPVAAVQPVVKRRVLTDKERAAREKEKEREKAKKEKEKELKLKKAEKPYPAPPKRPQTGFSIFFSENHKPGSGLGVTELASQTGAAWRELTEAQKEPYLKKAEGFRAQYKADVAKWVSSLSLAQLGAARQNKEPGTRGEAALSVLPKRPSNAYAIFFKEAISRPDIVEKVDAAVKKGGGESHISRIGLLGKTTGSVWRAMSEKEKQPYVSKAEEAKKAYMKHFGSAIATEKESWSASA